MSFEINKKLKVCIKILSILFNIGTVITFVVSIIFLFIVINSRKNSGNLHIGNYRLYTVASGSMGKAMPTGSLIIVKDVDTDSLKKGDIISFKSESIIITHRIYDIYEQANGGRVITTKGDANSQPDPAPVMSRNIVGRVQLKLPLAGFVLNFLRTKQALFIISFTLLGVCIFEIIAIFKNVNSYFSKKQCNSALPN